ncbi:hypothetical protein AAE478_008077 [Parahypoxylon ruwenzoriense]
MRLLHTSSLALHEFHGTGVPPYAILSHTWVEGEEVSFHDFSSSLVPPATRSKSETGPRQTRATRPRREPSGLRKIRGACEVARNDGFAWIWIDTVCIDKASSAELTEAINSMYNWYRGSAVCYAYLADVPDPVSDLKRKRDDEGVDSETLRYFRRSRWFSRGWTLQELLGPSRVVFFSCSWTRIGERGSPVLAGIISAVTGIDYALLHPQSKSEFQSRDRLLHGVSIAKKMSWAARRRTTRPEDAAYCLLGIFDVNMPLLYGEGGPKAFLRLQEEIIRTSNDHTVFCWSRKCRREEEGGEEHGRGGERGSGIVVPPDWSSMLAPSPAAFRDAGEYVPIDAWEIPAPHAMTNLGLSICLPVIYTLTQLFVVLDAGLPHDDDAGAAGMRACIAMQRTNQRRSGTNILDRSRFPDGPAMLSKEATDTRERYNLFIRSARHVPLQGLGSAYLHDPRRSLPHLPPPSPSLHVFKHGVLLFVDPTATRLLSTGKRDAPLGAVGYDVETHPPGVFDGRASLLRLPAFDGGSTLLTSALLRIRFKSPQETDLYLFFAVVTTLGGGEVWRCGAHSADEFAFIRLAIREQRLEDIENGRVDSEAGGGGGGGEEDPEAYAQEVTLIHSYLRSEAWDQRRRKLSAQSADESLYVAVGGSIAGDPSTDIRAAMLSGKGDSPYSVPVSAVDPTVDEDDDLDYVDESEDDEFEDWDSSNEEEEEEEDMSDESEKGQRGWESSESSQVFSSASQSREFMDKY